MRIFYCWFIWVPVFAFGQRQEFFHPQMGTLFQVILYCQDSVQAKKVAQEVFARLDSLNHTFSDYVEDSEINRLSAAAGSRQKLKVSRDMWRLVGISQRIARSSQGAFDLSIGPLSKLWRKAFRQMQFPTTTAIEEAQQKVHYQDIYRYPLQRKIELRQPGMRLDAGGIAKGFAVDEAMKIIRKAGIRRALVAGGGDVRVSKAPPQKEAWLIASKSADNNGAIVDIELHHQNRAVSTSGDTFRFLEWQGQRYSHIIDPRTGLGIQGQLFTRVTGPRSTFTDALATAANVMGIEGRLFLSKKFSKYQIEQYKSKD